MHYFAQNFQNFSGPQNPPLTFPPPISNFWIRHWPDCMFKLQQLSQICKAYLQKVLCFSVKTHTRSCFCRSTSTTVRLCQSFLFRRWLYLLQQGWWWWWTLKVLCIHVWGLLCRTVPWQHRTGGGVLHWLTNWDSCVPISHLTHQERSPPSSSSSAAATDFSQLQHLSGIIDWWTAVALPRMKSSFRNKLHAAVPITTQHDYQ